MSLRSCRQWRGIVKDIQSDSGLDYLNSLLDYDYNHKAEEYGADYPSFVIKCGSIADTYIYEPVIFLLQNKRDSAMMAVSQALKYFEDTEPELWYDAAYSLVRTFDHSEWYSMEEEMLMIIWKEAIDREDYVQIYEARSQLAELKNNVGERETARALASIDDMDMFISSNLNSYVRNMHTLGIISSQENDNLSAIKYLNRALSVLNGELPELYTSLDDKIRFNELAPADTTYLESTLLGLSICYQRMGQYNACEEVVKKQLQRKFGNDVPSWDNLLYPSSFMQELAIIKYYQKQYDEAISLFEDCLKYQNKYGWHTTGAESWLMSCFHDKGDSDGFEKHARAYLDGTIKNYLRQSSGMSENARAILWDSSGSSYMIDIMGHLYCYGIGQSAIGSYYDLALNYKGFLLGYSSFIENNIKSSSDEALKEAYFSYKDAVASGDTLRVARENLCMYLYSLHPEFLDAYIPQKWQDVQASLGKRDIAIEFVRCYGTSKEENTYNALLLTKKQTPVLIELCKESSLEDIAKKYKEAANTKVESLCNHLYQECNDSLYTNIWQKLLPYLKHANRVYFSPHGILSQLNIETVFTPSGESITELFEVRRVSTTGSIAESSPSEILSYDGTVLYGGLIYDTPEVTEPSNIIHAATLGINTTDRGKIDLRETLNGTEDEVKAIDKLLTTAGFTDILYTGVDGTENTFKDLSTLTAPVIHIATHGFYFDNEDAARQDYYSSASMFKGENNFTYIPPMRRAGLILSGARNAWEQGSINDDSDNILLAEEIAGVDLSKTNLLVLSACQTGLGEISGDGVYGLQRAFKLAGVGTIIMSLWNVDDNATQLMMATFYEKLLNGLTKRDSFNCAIAKVKQSYPSQKYWGAFIMLD